MKAQKHSCHSGRYNKAFYWRMTLPLMIGLIPFLVILVGGGNDVPPAQAQEPDGSEIEGLFVSEPVSPHVFNEDLRTLPKAEPWKPGDPVHERFRVVTPKVKPENIPPLQPSQPVRDPLLALQEGVSPDITALEFSTPDLNFEGIPFTGVRPPDTVGEIGPNHYIQMVNDGSGSRLTIHDKSGGVLAGPLLLDSLWTAGGACANGRGDPIVLYDPLAGRWLMSEFASTGNHLCVYISQTADPVAGGWFLYDFTTPDFPDYPKYAVWPDAYYVSSNEGAGSPAYALDRTQMLSGNPATFQRFTAPDLAGFPFQALIPSDLDGVNPPPAGAPNYFMRHRDDEVHDVTPNPAQDILEIWEFHVDFTTPANSSFTGPINIPITEIDSELCGLVSFNCFPQPGTGTQLDPLREVIMWRLQYRNFGSYEMLVGNLVTDVDGTDHGGIRWFELRKSGGDPWSLFQEGTYAPDAAHRWMGSIAMDQSGNVALGYSVSSGAVFPSIRYTGRLATDPAGTMPQGENIVINGGASQTASTRWGDYSSMNVDPADGCTFWYTNEYVVGGNWRTRIAAFKFDACGPPVLELTKIAPGEVGPGGTLSYTIVATNTGDAIAANIVITDTVPANTILNAASLSGDAASSGTGPGSVITWTTGASLAQSEALSRTFAVTVATGLAENTQITNTAYVSSTNSNFAQSNAVTTVVSGKIYLPIIRKAN